MMERTAAHELLASSAHRFARKVFASLSFSQRLAQVILKLGSAMAEGFGATVLSAALFYGSLGAPLLGDPAVERKTGESFKSFVNRMTRNPKVKAAGRAIGGKFYNFCKARFGEEGADDYLMEVIGDLMDPTSKLHIYFKVQEFPHIEANLYLKAKQAFLDMQKSRRKQKTDGVEDPSEEGGGFELEDKNLDPEHLPNRMVLKKLDEALDEPAIRRKVEEAARNLSPDLDTYFGLLMDGFEPREIYNLRLLPSMQTNLPPELRITDPTRSDPFHTDSPGQKDEAGLTNKQKELKFKEELEKYPNPTYGNPVTFMNQHKALMKVLQTAIRD